jgi:hypothetical protein
MNDSTIHEEQTYCAACAGELKEQPEVSWVGARQGVDPTVCGWCGRDNGSSPLPSDGVAPVCSDCHERHLRYPLPLWVQLFLVVALAAAAGGMVANARFFRAWTGIRQANREMGLGLFESGATLVAAAAAQVPESQDLEALSRFYGGMSLVMQNRSAEAAPLLRQLARERPDDDGTLQLALIAESNAAFEAHQYELMYQKATELRAGAPDEDWILLRLASAVACRYAETGVERFRREAEVLIRTVRGRVPAAQSGELEESIGRILYRLDSRQIIDRDEYYRRFPERQRSRAP